YAGSVLLGAYKVLASDGVSFGWRTIQQSAVAAGTGISVSLGFDGITYTVSVDSTIATKTYADSAAAAATATAEAYTDAFASFVSTTYATKASLSGNGYLKGAAGFVSFVTTVAVSELLNAGGATGDLLVGSSTSLV